MQWPSLTLLAVQCTDAVSVDVEKELYKLAEAHGITVLTISQRSALTGEHKQELRLLGNGAWDLHNTVDEEPVELD